MAHSVRRHLRVQIDDYDASIRRFIPGYESMLGVAAEAVASASPMRVLDLGAGTGALAEAVLDRTSETTVELLDTDPEMLGEARRRLARFGDRAHYRVRSFTGALPTSDAITASLALHHVPTITEKTELFRNAVAALPSGGVFVNADVTMPASAEAREIAYAGWAAHLVSHGFSEQEAWGHFEAWAEEDTYFPLESELRAMAGVGFEVDVLWRKGVSTVLRGRRP